MYCLTWSSCPQTSDFPLDPEQHECDVLNSTYLELRNCYSSLMRSRAQHRRLANKAKGETALLKERITALASRDLPQRKEIYELLEIVTAIAGDIEDAGDDLVNGFSRDKKGRHTFQGGGYLGNLTRAVIHFINRWGRTKDRLADLKQNQQELIDKSIDLMAPPTPPPGSNDHAPAVAPTPPPGDSAPGPIDVSMNGSQPSSRRSPQTLNCNHHSSPSRSPMIKPREPTTIGEIADKMRSALRQLAQADARLYRGLTEELGDGDTAVEEPRALIQPEGGAPATEAQLLTLIGDVLQELFAQRGIKVVKRVRKDQMVGPLPLSLLTPPKPKPSSGGKGTGATGGKAGSAELQALDQRLARLEQMMLLFAQQVGLPQQAIEQLAKFKR